MVDVALLQKSSNDGLTYHEATVLCRMLTKGDASKKVYPLDLEAVQQECSAMGFISTRAAALLDYDYENSGLHKFIANILDDVANENATGVYQFKGLDILLLYN